MAAILRRMGYQGEVLYYVTRKMCGIWFFWIGLVTVLGTLFSNHMCINPFLFSIGYGIGFYICYGNRKILFDKLASGKQSAFQKKMSDRGLEALAMLCGLFGMVNWYTRQSMRIIWLCIFVAVGVHFLLFYFVHGFPVVVLGGLCLLYAVIGLCVPKIPFYVIGFLDGVTKMAAGSYLFYHNKGSNENAFYRIKFLRS